MKAIKAVCFSLCVLALSTTFVSAKELDANEFGKWLQGIMEESVFSTGVNFENGNRNSAVVTLYFSEDWDKGSAEWQKEAARFNACMAPYVLAEKIYLPFRYRVVVFRAQGGGVFLPEQVQAGEISDCSDFKITTEKDSQGI